MFEDKPKPAEKEDKASSNMAKGGARDGKYPPADKKAIDKVKTRSSKSKFHNSNLQAVRKKSR